MSIYDISLALNQSGKGPKLKVILLQNYTLF